ncbi:importin-alpha export receptor [Massospora cicadina]|nr:importin-alpha export receptor [Massospora cicadina]
MLSTLSLDEKRVLSRERIGISDESIASLGKLLLQATDPATVKEAESTLARIEIQLNFLPLLLRLIETRGVDPAVQLAGAIYLKNSVLRRWYREGEVDDFLAPIDREIIKRSIINLLVASSENVQVQIGEAIALIAETDYPHKWGTLIQELCVKLSPNDFRANLGVLRTIHTVFKRFAEAAWRTSLATAELNDEIVTSVDAFSGPLFALLKEVSGAIGQFASDAQTLQPLMQCVFLMIKICYSLSYHDMPQCFEDNLDTLMDFMHFFLVYRNPLLESSDDEEAGILEKVRASVCEFAQLYHQKYSEEFTQLGRFVQAVWDLLVSVGPQPKYDMLTCQTLRFIGMVIRRRSETEYFESPEAVSLLCEKVIIPNGALREADMALFEDEPLEFVRNELDGSHSGSRRQACSELIRSLVFRFEDTLASVFTEYYNAFLARYAQNPRENWKDKDTAIFLFCAIAVKAQTAQSGATQISSQVDISQFFNDHIICDLMPETTPTTPILVVDAIKFIYLLRNQLSPNQLMAVLVPLVFQLTNPNPVVHTFAAIGLEGILHFKSAGQLVFSEDVLGPHLQTLLANLFRLCEKEATPEKLAENDFLMKAVMRTILIGKQTIANHRLLVAQKLGGLLAPVSANPSNPRYNHYLFECIGAVVRNANLTMAEFESLLWPPFQTILTQNVEEFVPYVLQLMGLMLDASNGPLPPLYQTFFGTMLQPAIWEVRGNTPALVRLLKSYVAKASGFVGERPNLEALLGVATNLLNSRLNVQYGFEVFACLFREIPPPQLLPYHQPIFLRILMRLKASPSDTAIQGCIKFLSSVLLIVTPGFSSDTVFTAIEAINAGAVAKLIGEFIAPKLGSVIAPVDKQLVVVGMTRMLACTSPLIQSAPNAWLGLLDSLLQLMATPRVGQSAPINLDTLDIDEIQFSAAFVKLATASLPEPDLTSKLGSPHQVFTATMAELNAKTQGQLNALLPKLSPQAQAALTQLSQA